MKAIPLFTISICLGLGLSTYAASTDSLETSFQNPPSALRPMPFWHMNGTLTTAEIKAQMQATRDQSGFGGLAVLPVKETKPEYLSDDYFASYADILNTARELGMEVILYDDTGFPSGSAGGKLKELYPDDVMHRLDLAETDVTGPVDFSAAVPADGKLVGVVAMNAKTFQRTDITASVSGGKVSWKAPEGAWKIMIFTCMSMGKPQVDYMSAESVDKFIPLTYGEYFKRFPEFFGSTIKRNFFDDVGYVFKPRPWTPAFGEKFQKTYGYSPVTLYPALWHDIGPETSAARVTLFGFCGELLAEGYPARVTEWCHAHGIQSQGHPPGNYDPCPVDMQFDIFKFYRHVDIPLMDAIFYHGHGRPGFKLVSSAATMYDRPLVAVEEYGAFKEATFDSNTLYGTGMEMFARGVNRMVPHGMWYDPEHVRISPLISHFSKKLLPALPGYNEWAARSTLLLQGGRPVVDIGVLYPIAAMDAYFNFNHPEKIRSGFYVPPECDYERISDKLTCEVRRDFTFVHPDELEKQCAVKGTAIHLNNPTTFQDYQVFIIPGGKVIPWASLQQIKKFYDQGGKVVATSRLPDQSAEPGHDVDVQAAIAEMFGKVPAVTSWTGKPDTGLPDPDIAAKPFTTHVNPKDGKAYFAPEPTTGTLQAILADALPVADVAFDPNLQINSGGGFLSYLHKQTDGREIYFFANSSTDAVDTFVKLRGNLSLHLWNPHTGTKTPAEVTHVMEHDQPVTQLHLKLAPVSTIFAVAPQTN